jgi:hypothetical protein
VWIALLLAGTGWVFLSLRALQQVEHPDNFLISKNLVALTGPLQKSDPEVEMELLLLDLAYASRKLADALELEANYGEKAFAGRRADQAYFSHWLEARRTVMAAQEVYSQMVEEYGRLIDDLAPPARSEAAAPLVRAMSALHAS